MSADAGTPGPPPAAAPGAAARTGGPPARREHPPKERGWLPAAAARGIALFFGGFTLVSAFGEARTSSFDENLWWVDLRLLPRAAAVALLVVLAGFLLAYAVAPPRSLWRRRVTVVLCLLFAVVTAWNGISFYVAWGAGDIRPGVPLPLSFLLCAAFAFLAWAALRPAARRRRAAATGVLLAVAFACVLAFPLAQVFFFGTTDYRRAADVAVVFGAQVHPGGRPSTSLRDRVDTAVRLYKDGLVKRLFVSGGVGDSGYNEALVMRDMAVRAGVPAKDIAVDSNGVSADATVADTVPFFGDEGWRRILAVSQFYHLPRVKLAYQRAGWDVLTVPAGTSTPIPQTPRLVAREIPAFWVYYLDAVFR